MQNIDITRTMNIWDPLANTLYVPRTEEECEQLVDVLDDLGNEVGEDESHPLASMMEVIEVLIENYEDENVLELGIAE